MAVRSWNGDTSELRVPVINASNLLEDFSVYALVSPNSIGSFQAMMAGYDTDDVLQWEFGINSDGQPYFFIADGSQTVKPTAGGVLDPDTYYIVGYTRQSVTGPRRFHIQELGGAMTHIAGDLGGSVNPPATTAGGYVAFGNSGSAHLDALMPVAGIWKVAHSDAQAEALGANDGSADWTEHAAPAGGVWNFNQTDETDAVPDLVGHHSAISGLITGAGDRNGITGTTIVFGSDPAWDFTTTPPPLRVTFRYSGGAANDDEALSIGGAESSEGGVEAEGLDGFLFNVLPDFDRPDAIAGKVIYRGFYAHLENNGFAAPADLTVWLEDLDLVTGVMVAIGLSPQGPGGTMQSLASETTAPTGVSFSTPTAEVDALTLGETAAEEGAPVWVRVTLGENLAGGLGNTCPFKIGVTPL